MQHASVVDQHVKLAARLLDDPDGGIDRRRRSQIDLHRFEIQVGTAKGLHGVFAGLEVTRSE